MARKQKTKNRKGTPPKTVTEAGRFIEVAVSRWKEGATRIHAQFLVNHVQLDSTLFLRAVLQYVTDMIDNSGYWNLRMFVWKPSHIEENYLPGLRNAADCMRQVAAKWATRHLQGEELE